MTKLPILLLFSAFILNAQDDYAVLDPATAEQIFEQSPVLCKVATYRSTSKDDVIGDPRPNGAALVNYNVLWEGVVVESYKGGCQPGDFVTFSTGGTEICQKPSPQPIVRNKRLIWYVQATKLEKLEDGRTKLVESERVPSYYVRALENLLKERKLTRQ